MVAIRLYVEGGGDGKSLKTACRRGFREFLKKAGLAGSMPRIIASGSRRSAYDDFCIAQKQGLDCAFLLVDSEEAVEDQDSVWNHLLKRKGDGWVRPAGAGDEQCHLMVQVMESWFLADRATLVKYFGKGFNVGTLPKREDIEAISKADVMRGLKNATRQTKSKGYSKGKHSFGILALIDPKLVRKASPYADRFLRVLANPEDAC